MGLDIMLMRYKGRNEDGSLIYDHLFDDSEYGWNSSRFFVRHKISENIDLEWVSSEKYYDPEAICRPKDFEKAYEWAETLDEGDKEYVKNILNILSNHKDLYLYYSY